MLKELFWNNKYSEMLKHVSSVEIKINRNCATIKIEGVLDLDIRGIDELIDLLKELLSRARSYNLNFTSISDEGNSIVYRDKDKKVAVVEFSKKENKLVIKARINKNLLY